MEEKYERLSKLGEGTYGIVYKVCDRTSGACVAMKCIRIGEEQEGVSAMTLREITALKNVDHPNVLKLIEVEVDEKEVTIVTEFLDFDLYKLLRYGKTPFSSELSQSYAFQLMCGLFALHKERFIHRDLKLENVLIDKEGNLKIGDLGMSRNFTLPMKNYTPGVVSTAYRAPELLCDGVDYDTGIDIWASGCIIAEMHRGSRLFNGDSAVDQLHQIISMFGRPEKGELEWLPEIEEQSTPQSWEDISGTDNALLIDLLRKMFTINPAKRINACEALKHPFFDTVPSAVRQKCLPSEPQ